MELNLYTRVPEELVTQLDVLCAKMRIKRPEAIRKAIEIYLRSEMYLSTGVGNPPEQSKKETGADSANEPPQTAEVSFEEANQIWDHLQAAEAIVGRIARRASKADGRGAKTQGKRDKTA